MTPEEMSAELQRRNALPLTLEQAREAYDLAQEAMRGVNDIEDLDEMSDCAWVDQEYPEQTEGQRGLIQHIFLQEYLRSIGRA